MNENNKTVNEKVENLSKHDYKDSISVKSKKMEIEQSLEDNKDKKIKKKKKD